jgi:hypothetical protein
LDPRRRREINEGEQGDDIEQGGEMRKGKGKKGRGKKGRVKKKSYKMREGDFGNVYREQG